MSDIYWQIEGCQEAQKKEMKRLRKQTERCRAELEVERKVSAAMYQQQKALMAELAAKDVVVEAARVLYTEAHWKTSDLGHGEQIEMWEMLRDALRALDAAKGGDDEK